MVLNHGAEVARSRLHAARTASTVAHGNLVIAIAMPRGKKQIERIPVASRCSHGVFKLAGQSLHAVTACHAMQDAKTRERAWLFHK